MGLELADGSTSDGINLFTNPVECVLSPGERVTSANLHFFLVDWLNRVMVGGVEFVTTQKTCSLFGKTGSKLEVVRGHRLLYVGGWKGLFTDALHFTFDYGCDLLE